MGRPTGLEPATPRSTILCSNQLSYDRRKGAVNLMRRPTAVNPILAASVPLAPGGPAGLDFSVALPKPRISLPLPMRCRLLTFNIAHARGLGLHQGLRTGAQIRAQLLKIARLIERVGADVIALQEIDEHSRWNGSFDHLAYLRDHTGLPHAVHGVNNRWGGRFPLNYGNAVLSRFPIHHHETVPFGRSLIGGKGFLFAEVDTPRGRLPLVNIHLHHHSRRQRLHQAAEVMKFVDTQRAHRRQRWRIQPVICGDLNNPSHEPDATATLLGYLEQFENYTLLPKGRKLGRAEHTFPSLWPQRALDYILLPAGCRDPEVTVVRSFLSDHRPVLVEFGL